MTVRIQAEPFDAQAEADALRAGDLEVGAIVSFVGTVRDVNDGSGVSTLLGATGGVTCPQAAPMHREAAATTAAGDAITR